MKRGQTQILVYIALLVAQAVVISLVERMLPSPFASVPGAKLGLGNIITLIAIFTLPFKLSLQVVVLRLLVTLLVGGTFATFLYSVTGAFVSYAVMLLLQRLGSKRVSIIGISISGGMFFNVGQLVAISLQTQTWSVWNYLPLLSVAGMLAGLAVGVIAYYLLNNSQILRRYHQELMQQQGNQLWIQKR